VELAHISDIHVMGAPLAGERWQRYVGKRILGGFNLLTNRSHPVGVLHAAIEDLCADPPDHVAVTGDLTNLAFESEFSRACEILSRLPVPPQRRTIIPGNHDAYTRLAHATHRFNQFVGPLMGDPGLEFPYTQRVEDVLFLSLDSAVATPFLNAYGVLGAEQLAEAERLLAETDAPIKVVLVHHPPILGNGKPDRRTRNNRDGKALIALCQRQGVQLLLCGHTHRAFQIELPGERVPLLVSCAGSTTKFSAIYRRYRLYPDRVLTENRRYDRVGDRFVPCASTVQGALRR